MQSQKSLATVRLHETTRCWSDAVAGKCATHPTGTLATSMPLAAAALKPPPDTAPAPDVGGSLVSGGLAGGGLVLVLDLFISAAPFPFD